MLNAEELQQLDGLLQDYVESSVGVRLLGPTLKDTYTYSEGRPDQGRFVAAFLDLQLGSALLTCDFFGPHGIHQSLAGMRRGHCRSPLSSAAEFTTTLHWHHALSGFILRYRSLWDKIMGCLVLMYQPRSYEKFLKADSRKKKFRRLASEFQAGAIDIVSIIDGQISRFDDIFRTPEAHGAGSIRKWTLSSEPAFETPQVDLVAYWNLFGETMERMAASIRSGAQMRKLRTQ